jgi:hypothetical protein
MILAFVAVMVIISAFVVTGMLLPTVVAAAIASFVVGPSVAVALAIWRTVAALNVVPGARPRPIVVQTELFDLLL